MNRFIACTISVMAIAIGASFAFVPAMGLMFLMPAIALIQRSRRAAYVVAFAYYALASWAMVPAARNFFGPTPAATEALLLWLTASNLLATPWAAMWTTRGNQIIWRIPLGLAISVIPPLGIIGWASPLSSAGILFPGAGWFGLIATATLPGLMIAWPAIVATIVMAGVIVCNVACPTLPSQPSNWESADTNLGGIAHGQALPFAEFAASEAIQERAKATGARVILFPETVVPMWTDATDLFWSQTLAEMRARGETIALGVGKPAPDASYRNALLIAGAERAIAFQRIPVPLGMWKPFAPDAVPLNLFDRGVVQIGGRRAAVLICYEQLLTWPILQSMAASPTVILAVANDYWATNTPIPRCQAVLTWTWSRLFGLPFLSATNR